MPRSRALAVGLLAAAATSSLAVPAVSSSASAAYTVQTLHFAVSVGPDGTQHCDIVGDL